MDYLGNEREKLINALFDIRSICSMKNELKPDKRKPNGFDTIWHLANSALVEAEEEAEDYWEGSIKK